MGNANDILLIQREGRIQVFCGVEADYVPGGATPDRAAYAAIAPDYIIGSVHFDVAGHLDLVRKFNVRHPYFDESAPWYMEELVQTADAVAA